MLFLQSVANFFMFDIGNEHFREIAIKN